MAVRPSRDQGTGLEQRQIASDQQHACREEERIARHPFHLRGGAGGGELDKALALSHCTGQHQVLNIVAPDVEFHLEVQRAKAHGQETQHRGHRQGTRQRMAR